MTEGNGLVSRWSRRSRWSSRAGHLWELLSRAENTVVATVALRYRTKFKYQDPEQPNTYLRNPEYKPRRQTRGKPIKQNQVTRITEDYSRRLAATRYVSVLLPGTSTVPAAYGYCILYGILYCTVRVYCTVYTVLCTVYCTYGYCTVIWWIFPLLFLCTFPIYSM